MGRKSAKFLLIISHQLFYSPGHLQCSEPEYDTCTPLEAVASQVSRVQPIPGSSIQSRVQNLVQGLVTSPGPISSPGSSIQSRQVAQQKDSDFFVANKSRRVGSQLLSYKSVVQPCRDKSSDNQIASLSSRQVVSQWMLLLTSQSAVCG